MFSTNFKKTGYSFAESQVVEKSNCGGQNGGHIVKRLLP